MAAAHNLKRDLIWLTVLAMAAFAVLLGLGFWQLSRLEWKQGLIARIEARTRAAPVSLEAVLSRWDEMKDVEYLRVRLKGRFRHDVEQHLYHVLKGETGWRTITPLESSSGRIVMVDRGFVPDSLKRPETRKQGQVEGVQSLIGLSRAPGKKGFFTPDSAPGRNIWYWRDLQGMAETALSSEDLKRLVPFFVELEAGPVPGGWPKGGVTRLALPNRHLQYAVTWFGMAAGLLGVLAVYLRGRLRRRPFT